MPAVTSFFRTNGSRRTILAWLFACVAAVVISLTGVGHEVEQQLGNARSSIIEKPATGQVVIVEIDAKSLQSLDRWPWPREYYGKLVNKLSDAGVSQIAFDVDFSSHSTAEQDEKFAAAINKSNISVVLPTFRQKSSSENNQYIESLPIESLRENAFLASVNVHPDNRGQLHQYSFGTTTENTARPSFASMLAQTSGNINESFDIDQSIDPATIPRISFIDILNDEFDPSTIKGKTIMVGATAIELGDRYPMSRFGIVPGIVIQALAVETLLQGTNIPNLGAFLPLAFAAIFLLTCILMGRWRDKIVARIAFAIPVIISVLQITTEHFAQFTFSSLPVFLFIGIFLILESFFKTSSALKNSRFSNAASTLPNEAAFARFVKNRGQGNIATALLTDFHELLVITDKESRESLFLNLANRLKFLAEEERIFHLDTDMIAWVTKDEYANDIGGHFDAAIALFHSPVMAGETKIKLAAVFGISDQSIDKSKVAADQALAAGKKWMWHDEELDDAIGQKQNVLVELNEAIDSGQITVVYQPKWDLRTDSLQGAEALVRWNHPKQGKIGPDIFIPMLEKAGQIDALTLHVLRAALKQLSGWERKHPGLSCSVNISAQLLGDSKFVEQVVAIVDSAQINNSQVIFEVTETAALADLELSILALNRVRDAGIEVSIDDYGTGQSTMSYLQRLPVNEIKIDQSFVKTMTQDNANRVMVKSTIEMAHALGFKVVAEGIEDQACMEFLTKQGCDVGQGWHISKAVESDVFESSWLNIAVQDARKSA